MPIKQTEPKFIKKNVGPTLRLTMREN